MTSLHHQAHYMEFPHSWYLRANSTDFHLCHMQVYLSRNYIPMVKSSPKHTSPPSMVATFLATHLMVVLQLSGYFIFHSGDTPIQLNLP